MRLTRTEHACLMTTPSMTLAFALYASCTDAWVSARQRKMLRLTDRSPSNRRAHGTAALSWQFRRAVPGAEHWDFVDFLAPGGSIVTNSLHLNSTYIKPFCSFSSSFFLKPSLLTIQLSCVEVSHRECLAREHKFDTYILKTSTDPYPVSFQATIS